MSAYKVPRNSVPNNTLNGRLKEDQGGDSQLPLLKLGLPMTLDVDSELPYFKDYYRLFQK